MVDCRKIIHIDMDAFFAAIEQRDFPEYRNKPVVVGGDPCSRGVVATCSYEARSYGIHSAMPASRAYRLCPQAFFVKPRLDVYREVSRNIRNVFLEYTDLVEPLSLDEAFLDVTDAAKQDGSATLIAKAIKSKIKQYTQLTASAGVSYNKFLAKIASDINKPDGLFVISPNEGERFVEQLRIEQFHGVGNATAKKMHELGIFSGKELKTLSPETLQAHFGKSGAYYYAIARGIDHRPVVSRRQNRSVGVELTYQQDIEESSEIIEQLLTLFEKALCRLAEKRLNAHTLTVKVKYHDFVQITRSRTLPQRITAGSEIRKLLDELLRHTDVGRKAVRLLGISLSSLDNTEEQHSSSQADIFESG